MAGISLASALLLMVFLIGASHSLDPASSAPSTSVEYWQTILPSFPLPVKLLKRVSPLDSSPALLTRYTQMMSAGRAGVRPGMSSLCMDGRLYCSSSQFAAFRQVFIACNIMTGFRKPTDLTAQQLNQGGFFRESDLVEGALLVLGDQKDRAPSAPFLPRQLASKLYPASPTLLQAAFGIPPSSLLATESTHTSQSLCKADAEDLLPGEEAFCAYSLEDLADELKTRVVADTSGSSLQLLPVSSSSADTVQARLLKVKLEVEAAQPYLSCHAETYPFAVHFCHHIPNTRIYSATFQAMHASSSEIVRAVAICHMDTSNWSPQHVAFADLRTTPGRTEACHWTHENSLIFVATKS